MVFMYWFLTIEILKVHGDWRHVLWYISVDGDEHDDDGVVWWLVELARGISWQWGGLSRLEGVMGRVGELWCMRVMRGLFDKWGDFWWISQLLPLQDNLCPLPDTLPKHNTSCPSHHFLILQIHWRCPFFWSLGGWSWWVTFSSLALRQGSVVAAGQ